MVSLQSEITRLKNEKDIAILAHYYTSPEIQEIADFIGDSYYLAKVGTEISQGTILLVGVVFMAESVKILNPKKKVLVPDLGAGCSLVESAPFENYLKWKNSFKNPILVSYINSSTQNKSISDVIVTSSNAEKIISSIPRDRKILFGPDQHLGNFLKKKTGRDMELWKGSCQVHVLFDAKNLALMLEKHPGAVVLAHPECEDSVLAYANVIGSTSKLLEEVSKNPAKIFIVATETGIFHQMRKARPDAEIIQAPVQDSSCACNDCPYMKLNSLDKIKKAMQSGSPEIAISEDLRKSAMIPLQRMMDISSGKSNRLE